ncbi:MAG: DHH family phosphoesterase [Lachnospiraceae bacterium]|nr:DHH family phosphoesterase [Lachnospiraceae bacterium]
MSELLKFNEIVIQCHDNPDADALASGFALYTYLKDAGKKVSLIYGGKNRIRKSNLVIMIQELKIPVKYCENMEAPELLVTIDCRYGESNVEHFPAKNIAVIDHHRVTGPLPELADVRSNLGSCSTIMWQLLQEEGYDVNSDKKLATALYYGLYTDTNELTEISHPLDMDLRDEAEFNAALITRLRNANLSLEELEVAGAALLRSDYNEDYRFAVVKAGECDPNILGIISDLVLAVDSVDTCMVFNIVHEDVKISVRSCIKEVKASELAQAICEGIGGGGGHFVKAGGRIKMELLTREYIKYCNRYQITPRLEPIDDGTTMRPSSSGVKYFLEMRMREYFDNTEIIDVDDFLMHKDNIKPYPLKKIPLGYVVLDELFPVDTKIVIRTIQGDMEMEVQNGVVLLIGIQSEIYVLEKEEFEQQYDILEGSFKPEMTEYMPTIKNMEDGKVVQLMEHAGICISTETISVNAKRLERKTKLFTQWNDEIYMTGKVGDYLTVRGDKGQILNIIDGELFTKYYCDIEG